MKLKLDFNPKVIEKLKKNNIPVDDGRAFLLCKYLNIKASFFPEDLENKILSLGVYTIDYNTNKISWNFDLFGDSSEDFDWVKEYVEMFGRVNKNRKGGLSTTVPKMKKLFLNNPNLTKEIILEATKIYLREADPLFIMDSQYFLIKNNYSRILDYVERVPLNEKGEVIVTSSYKENEDFI